MGTKDLITLVTQLIALVGIALALAQRFARFETNTEAKLTQQSSKLDELKASIADQKADFDKALARFESDTKDQIRDLARRAEENTKYESRILVIEKDLVHMNAQIERIATRISSHNMPAVKGHGGGSGNSP